MRSRLFPLIVLVALAACQRSDATDHSPLPDSAALTRGPDPVLLRIPRTGGTIRAYLYPKLDSVAWTGNGSSITRVLGFDPEGGTLAIIDGKDRAARIDLRLGESAIASRSALTSLASANGADIYGIDAKGALARLTRVNDWSLPLPTPARAVFPQLDGSVLVLAQQKGALMAWRVRPPMEKLLDTAEVGVTLSTVRAQAGDRVYFGTDSGLVGIQTRDLSTVAPIHLSGAVTAIAPTPSGDRMYVAAAGQAGVSIIDRYTDRVSTTIELPGAVKALRMDPLGRYVLAQPMSGDSAWVIAVATDRLIGAVSTRWRADLPAPAPDGAIAVVNDRDVLFVDGETLQAVRTVVDGAKDYWYFMFWNGFRPRARGLDQPVSFAGEAAEDTTVPPIDSSIAPVPDAAATGTSAPGTGAPVPAPTVSPATPAGSAVVRSPGAPPTPASAHAAPKRFLVSFAAFTSEPKATHLADSIIVNGVKARVVVTHPAGGTVYRIVLGPYPTRALAEQIGKDSKRTYWVYPDEP